MTSVYLVHSFPDPICIFPKPQTHSAVQLCYLKANNKAQVQLSQDKARKAAAVVARQTDHVEEGESLPRCGRQQREVCVSTKVLIGRPESRRKMLSVDFAHAQVCIHKESFISSLFPASERRCCGCSSPYPASFLLGVVQSKNTALKTKNTGH